MTVRFLFAAATVLALASCGAAVRGTHQTVAVKSAPAGGLCWIDVDGRQVSEAKIVPAKFEVPRSPTGAAIFCEDAEGRRGEAFLTSERTSVYGPLSPTESGKVSVTAIFVLPDLVTTRAIGADYRFPRDEVLVRLR